MGKTGEINPSKDWSPFKAYGNQHQKHIAALPDLIVICLVIIIASFLYIRSRSLAQYNWQWSLLFEFLIRIGKDGQWEPGLLLTGLFTTLRVGFWTFILSIIAGLLIGALAASKSWGAPFFCQIYVNLIRNTPPLIILFCVYFFAGNLLPIGILDDTLRHSAPWLKEVFGDFFAQPGQLDRMIAAVLALGCYQGAYVAEIIRGGIESVPKQQWDAALALGFSRIQALRLVIIPQAGRLMLPPLTSQCITTFKDTALASLISLPDLTFQSLEIMAVSNMTFEIWITTAIIYLIIGAFCAILGWFLERKYTYA